MGIYGCKLTPIVHVVALAQITLAILIFGNGIALRILVCGWVSDASFGFWVGTLFLIGGIVGYVSTRTDNYSVVGFYLGLNSFCIMFACMVIFCHFIATFHFNDQMLVKPPNISSAHSTSVNSTSNSSNESAKTTRESSSGGNDAIAAIETTNSSGTTSSISISQTLNATPSTSHQASKTKGVRCYWSDYENGHRGLLLGITMMSLCFIEVVTASFAMFICWAAVNVEPTGIRRKKLLVQGTASEMLALYNRETTLQQRTGLTSTSTSLATIDEPFSNWNSTTTC